MNQQTDRVIRAITDDGAFRVIALRGTDTVRGVLAAQKATGEHAALLGELLLAAVMVRETMAPGLRVQVMLKGAERGSLVADSHPDGMTRGLAQLPEGHRVALTEGALLQVVRTMPRAELHQSIVEASGDKGISGALMRYMQESEQVVSMLRVACVFGDDGALVSAGGFIVQLLPEVSEGPLMLMTERLNDFDSIDRLLVEHDADPAVLLGEVLYRYPHQLLMERPIHAGCNCSSVRVIGALATLGHAELTDMVAEGKTLDIECDYCGRSYQVGTEQLRTLTEPPS